MRDSSVFFGLTGVVTATAVAAIAARGSHRREALVPLGDRTLAGRALRADRPVTSLLLPRLSSAAQLIAGCAASGRQVLRRATVALPAWTGGLAPLRNTGDRGLPRNRCSSVQFRVFRNRHHGPRPCLSTARHRRQVVAAMPDRQMDIERGPGRR